MTLRLSRFLRSLTLSDIARPSQHLASLSSVASIPLVPTARRVYPAHHGAIASTSVTHQSFLPSHRCFHAASSRLDFRLNPVLFGEPLKKKRKIDPALLKKREDRIRGKIERALDRLGRFADKLKPIDEFEVPRALMKEREARTRVVEPLSFEESEKRAKLKREYSEWSTEMYRVDAAQIKRVHESQRRAMAELKAESEELYLKAVETDDAMLEMMSPILTSTPPIAGYEAPDGGHNDVTKTFEYEVDFMTVLEANLSHHKPKWQLKKEAKEAAALLEDDDDIKKEKKKKEKKQASSGPPPLNP